MASTISREEAIAAVRKIRLSFRNTMGGQLVYAPYRGGWLPGKIESTGKGRIFCKVRVFHNNGKEIIHDCRFEDLRARQEKYAGDDLPEMEAPPPAAEG